MSFRIYKFWSGFWVFVYVVNFVDLLVWKWFIKCEVEVGCFWFDGLVLVSDELYRWFKFVINIRFVGWKFYWSVVVVDIVI